MGDFYEPSTQERQTRSEPPKVKKKIDTET